FIESDSTLKWFIDGIEQADVSTERIFFTVDKPIGSVYNVSLEAEYVQSTDVRRALQKFWGIQQSNSTEITMNESVQIEIEAGNPLANKSGIGKILATLSANISGEIFFLLRIILTIFVLVATASLIFGFYPSEVGEKNRN
ncbi:MAG: Uncharacterized protein Athens101428_86, partial [Candidatus Berkelbacteria bacterium Athens1014_28]